MAVDYGGELGTDEALQGSRLPLHAANFMGNMPVREAVEDFAEVERRIGYTFQERAFLRRALIHASADAVSEDDKDQAKRLSWLGDSVLNLVVADKVFKLFPSATKKRLHDMRERLTNNKTLGRAATQLGLDPFLFKGASLKKDPVARDRHRMLATAFESLIGAVYLDGGLPKARTMIRHALEEDFRAVLES